MADSSPMRSVLTVVMDILIVIAVVETFRIIVMFFGQLASQSWGETVVALTNPITGPFGVEAVKTPYGGVFDIEASITVGVMLVVEWMLSVVKSRA